MSLKAHPPLLLSFLLVAAAPRSTSAQIPQREHPAPAPIRPASRFSLTPTRNIWVSLLLDSSNGRIWQVHYSVGDEGFTGRLPINEQSLVPAAAAHAGRFTLQETTNIFTFLLLDHDDGRVWQVQWSHDDDKRGMVRQLSQPLD